MNNMHDRLRAVREHLCLNQESFGDSIGITRSHVSSLEQGRRKITDRVVSDVCREFNVDDDWLRTGEGEMFLQLDTDNDLARQVAKLMGNDNPFVKELILMMLKLDEHEWDFVKGIIKKIKDNPHL